MQKFNLLKDVLEDMPMSITLWIWCTISMEAKAFTTHTIQHRPIFFFAAAASGGYCGQKVTPPQKNQYQFQSVFKMKIENEMKKATASSATTT